MGFFALVVAGEEFPWATKLENPESALKDLSYEQNIMALLVHVSQLETVGVVAMEVNLGFFLSCEASVLCPGAWNPTLVWILI